VEYDLIAEMRGAPQPDSLARLTGARTPTDREAPTPR
jgi:hypothetical protein